MCSSGPNVLGPWRVGPRSGHWQRDWKPARFPPSPPADESRPRHPRSSGRLPPVSATLPQRQWQRLSRLPHGHGIRHPLSRPTAPHSPRLPCCRHERSGRPRPADSRPPTGPRPRHRQSAGRVLFRWGRADPRSTTTGQQEALAPWPPDRPRGPGLPAHPALRHSGRSCFPGPQRPTGSWLWTPLDISFQEAVLNGLIGALVTRNAFTHLVSAGDRRCPQGGQERVPSICHGPGGGAGRTCQTFTEGIRTQRPRHPPKPVHLRTR